MGTEPLEEEMPIDENDLTYESNLALQVYRYLPDIWAGMSGHYLGKDLASLNILFDIFSIDCKELKKYILLIIKILDIEVSNMVSEKIKNETKSVTNKARTKR